MIHDSVATSRRFIAPPSCTRRQAWERAYTDKVELSQSQESHNLTDVATVSCLEVVIMNLVFNDVRLNYSSLLVYNKYGYKTLLL